MSHLFQPLNIGGLELHNRIVIAPMCQYSAHEGTPGDWHLIHLGQLALSGAGLMIVEATAVSAEGRITPTDMGLYSDANEQGLARVLAAVRAHSAVKVGIQLAHAGRKASSRAPWDGGAQIKAGQAGAWPAVAPSATPHLPSEEPPLALDPAGLQGVREAFADAARHGAPHASASKASRSTPRTATCCTNSCRRWRTSATMRMAAAWRTACVFRSKSSTPCVRPSLPTSRCGCAGAGAEAVLAFAAPRVRQPVRGRIVRRTLAKLRRLLGRKPTW